MASFKQEYRRIKQDIFAMHNPLKGIIAFFNNSSIDTIKKYEALLSREELFHKSIAGTFFPSNLSMLDSNRPTPYFRDIEKTLLWYTFVLKMGAKEINAFLISRAEFDHAFLWGEYEKCLNLLDECHRRWGWSVWEIKNRIIILNELEGFDGQKQYTKQILSELVEGSVLYYLIYNFSKQCERNVSFYTYQNTIQHDYNRFLSGQVPVNSCKYARYKANGYIFFSTENTDFLNLGIVNYFLSLDNRAALIDRYLSFCNIAANVFALNSELCNYFLPCFATLASEISDPFLKNVFHLWQKHYPCFHIEGSDRICEALDLYAVGQYERSRAMTEELLQDNIVFFPVAELYAKNCIYFPKHIPITDRAAVIDTILRKLRQLFIRQGDIMEIQTDLLKMLYIHLDAVWSKELLLIIERHNNQLTVLEDIKTSNFYTSISTPSDIFLFSPEYLDDYLTDTSSAYRDSLSTRLAVAVRKKNVEQINDLPIDPIRKRKYEASLLIEREPERALELLEHLWRLPEAAPVQMEINAMRVKANLQKGNLLQAMDIFVPTFSDNSNFIHIGYIDRIFKAIKSGNYDVRSSILTPIICSMYFNYYPSHDDRDDVIWSICYDEYLASCGVKRPSELLKSPPVGVSDADYVRFLAEVCVPNVMDRSITFTLYDEVLSERRDICFALIELDPTCKEKYANEIERLTKHLLVSHAKREVENGKIYFDEEGIRALLGKEVCESYERYMEFRASDINEKFVQILNTINERTHDNETSELKIFFFRDIKPTDMFRDIVRQIRDIFVADNKYGLDGCLSVRIRHGTLESRLRSCFEKHKLITTKAPDGTYRKNEFWYKKGWQHTTNEETIDKIFSTFATQIDQIITHLKKNLIQIRTEDKNQDGLFNFTIDENFIAYVNAKTLEDTTFEDFETIMLKEMSNMTDSSLRAVRDVLQNEINTSFQKALKNLETDLKGSKSTSLNLRGLSDQIAMARTDISTELQNISEWFHLAQPNSFADYSPSVALSISCDMMQKSHAGFALKCTQNKIDDDICLKGYTLPNFVDIFNILLDNVIKHSGFSHNASVKISVRRDNDNICIHAENPVKSGNMDQTRIQEVEDLLKHWESKGYVNREGGSGLHKIKKILTVDLNCKNTIAISGENDVFCIQIIAELGGVLL